MRNLLSIQQATTAFSAGEPDARAEASDALAHQAALGGVLLCGSVFNAAAMWLCGLVGVERRGDRHVHRTGRRRVPTSEQAGSRG